MFMINTSLLHTKLIKINFTLTRQFGINKNITVSHSSNHCTFRYDLQLAYIRISAHIPSWNRQYVIPLNAFLRLTHYLPFRIKSMRLEIKTYYIFMSSVFLL